MKGKKIGSHGDLYKKKLPFDVDLERGEKEKEGNTRAKVLGRVCHRIHAGGSHFLSIIAHFPIILLFSLMFSSLYSDATLPLCAALITSMIITITASIFR